MDVNYNDFDPESWLLIGDRFIVNFPEAQRFYAAVISDPVRTKTIFLGAQSVWRTSNGGGDRAFLEAHCNTAIGEFPSDLLFTGACGTPEDWPKLGTSTLTNSARRRRTGRRRAATRSRRSRVRSTAARCGPAPAPAACSSRGTSTRGSGERDVHAPRHGRAAGPRGLVDLRRPDEREPRDRDVLGLRREHADDAGPRVQRRVRPGTGTATWTNISYDIGDQPVNDAVLDTETGNIYVSTDFGVNVLVRRHADVGPGRGRPADGRRLRAHDRRTRSKRRRLLYAATHGRGAYRLRLK